MDYEIKVTVTSDFGEEIYKRSVALPEQIEMLRADIEAHINNYEDCQDELHNQNAD